ncbi:hypothetical protein BEI61_04022 [Eisenbergiella tayi]|uniref:Tail fiber protein n=2 Tax=Eisenbergiella tayi TaxID=1432052 RepID=A0A1E3A3B7_9FIRM|nr:hypothetical protein BEI61_04022 [Eisenbergiella tayi]
MQLTPNYRLMKPDGTDPVNVQDLNSNMDVLDEEVIKKLDKAGDASNVVNAFSQAGTRTNLTSGEKLSTSLGKLMKWFADFAKVAFSGNYADLTGRPTIPAGGIADASKVIDDIDDIAANTQAGYMAGALALKKVNSDLGGYEFDTINGVPSYKAGADAAWVPFKREPIIEKASFSWAYSPSQTFPAKEGYKIVGLYADITGINSQNAVNINFGISKNLAAGRISISGQTYVNIMGAFYCIYA